MGQSAECLTLWVMAELPARRERQGELCDNAEAGVVDRGISEEEPGVLEGEIGIPEKGGRFFHLPAPAPAGTATCLACPPPSDCPQP